VIRSLAALLGLAVAVSAGHAPAASVQKRVPAIVAERIIPLTLATDVRWLDGDHVLVADADRGLARIGIVSSRDTSVSWMEEWLAPTRPGLRYFHLALSEKALVASDFAFALRWKPLPAGAIRELPIEYIADVDARGDRFLVSGLRRDPDGRLGADGAVAWLGTLANGEIALRPLLPFKSRAAIENCAGFGLGVVRFLADGSAIVAPGAERNVYRFGTDGRLSKVWNTDEMGVNVDCELTRDEQMVLGTKPAARQQWVNKHVVIDDIVETPYGRAALLRKTDGRKTTWSLVALDDGVARAQTLPVTSPSPWAHAAAATRGRELVLLIADRLADAPDGALPRLIRLRWPDR
jgi:hypothetical protein